MAQELKFTITVSASPGFDAADVAYALLGVQINDTDFYGNGNSAVITAATPV
jgi:hypothetical protein